MHEAWGGVSCRLNFSAREAAENPNRWDRKKDAGSHELERVPVSTHTATTAAYRLLWQGHVRAAHGIRILPDLIPYLGMH